MRSSIESAIDTPTSVPFAKNENIRSHDDFNARNDFSAHKVGPWPNSAGKRLFDILVSGTALILISPLFLLIAAIIKLTSRGPIFFKQLRMGKNHVAFHIYKFRTMHTCYTQGPLVTLKNDSRITSAGSGLRRFKLDELPQLYNVLRGNMSLVGPRPKVLGHENYEMRCKPGITGAATLIFAQEHHLLAQIPEEKVESFMVEVLHRIKAQVDHEYELNSTFLTDLNILVRTPMYITGLGCAKSLQGLADTQNAKAEPTPVEAAPQAVKSSPHTDEAIIYHGFPSMEQSVAVAVERSHTSTF
jgi:lipopolysaccharide/colanic/teichoic acid biosynthesis glycosyltransferase